MDYDRECLEKLCVLDLKVMCRDRKLKVAAKDRKPEIVQKLLDFLDSHLSGPLVDEVVVDVIL